MSRFITLRRGYLQLDFLEKLYTSDKAIVLQEYKGRHNNLA